jgi:protein-S-isoprenylcysteine O-methyltransferase Ste14
MFLLIQAAQVGFLLSLPSVFTLVCLLVGMVAIHAQARLEERHLEARHGEAYARYRAKTPRWLVGRRRR